MLNNFGSKFLLTDLPRLNIRAQEYMLTEIIKFVAAQGVYAEFLGW